MQTFCFGTLSENFCYSVIRKCFVLADIRVASLRFVTFGHLSPFKNSSPK